MNNLFDLLKMIKNPQEYVMNYAKQNGNPMINNLIQMAQNGNQQGIENFARNVFKEQGKDFDKIIESIK